MTTREGYLRSFRKYGVDPRALKWQSQKAAEQRYREIVSLVNFKGRSILDVGCGFGGIIPFIASRTKKFSYTGIDKIAEFVKEARNLYPKQTFITGDYFAKPLKGKFDVVIANGSLNSNLKNNIGFRREAIRAMFEHAKEAVVFNLAGGYPQPKTAKDSNIWFADALEILRFCLDLTPRVTFINHPGRREFSLRLL